MELNNIEKSRGVRKSAKRKGRGIGSGKGGHTTGRGNKGQKARTGYNLPVGFEGGQVPLYKKLPRLGGFKSSKRTNTVILSLSILNIFEDGSKVTPAILKEKGILRKLDKRTIVKFLGDGEINKKLELDGFIYSESAKEKLEKSGAKIS